MPKIVAVLVLTALTALVGALAHDAPVFEGCTAAAVSQEGSLSATATPPLMYAGIRG